MRIGLVTAQCLAALWVTTAASCASEGDDGSTGASNGSAGADGAAGTDGTVGTDGAAGTGGVGLTDPPLPEWPAVQPGLDDPTARKWFRAGNWYSADPKALDTQMRDAFAAAADGPLGDAQGAITPHAGFKACGKTAAKTWGRITVPDTVIILAPNHIDTGARAAIWDDGPWLIPGLAIPTRHDIVARLLELIPGELTVDRVAFEHQNAHPSEMPLVYLSRKNPNLQIVQISFFDDEKVEFVDFDAARVAKVGHAVAAVVSELQAKGENVLLLASSDLSHYEPLAQFDPKDGLMMEKIQALDVDGLRKVVVEGNFTVCSEIALSVWMVAMKELGYTGLDVAERGNSVELSGEKSAVGYPVGIVWR